MKTRPARPEESAAVGGLARECPTCGAIAGVECRTSGGNPVQGYYVYANDMSERARNPGVHVARMTPDDYARVRAAGLSA